LSDAPSELVGSNCRKSNPPAPQGHSRVTTRPTPPPIGGSGLSHPKGISGWTIHSPPATPVGHVDPAVRGHREVVQCTVEASRAVAARRTRSRVGSLTLRTLFGVEIGRVHGCGPAGRSRVRIWCRFLGPNRPDRAAKSSSGAGRSDTTRVRSRRRRPPGGSASAARRGRRRWAPRSPTSRSRPGIGWPCAVHPLTFGPEAEMAAEHPPAGHLAGLPVDAGAEHLFRDHRARRRPFRKAAHELAPLPSVTDPPLGEPVSPWLPVPAG